MCLLADLRQSACVVFGMCVRLCLRVWLCGCVLARAYLGVCSGVLRVRACDSVVVCVHADVFALLRVCAVGWLFVCLLASYGM